MAFDPVLLRWIYKDAPKYGLDPRAVAAIAWNESGGQRRAVGDGGTSFGFAQLHRGGALPAGKGLDWAASRAGVNYALQHMGQVARGLHGQAAIAAIARRFERPADPAAEIRTALSYYGRTPQAGGGGPLRHGAQTRFITRLRSALGTSYQWGGTSLQNGVDCSGLVWAAARAAGIKGVPRTSQQQFQYGRPVGMGNLKPGDLVFSNWGSEQGAGHVSVYLGNGKIIEAASAGHPVSIKPLSVLQGHVLGARRILANPAGHVVSAGQFQQQQGNSAAAALAAFRSYNPQLPDRSQTPTAQQNVQNYLLSHQPKPNAGLQALQAIAPQPANPYQQALTPQLRQQAAQTGLDELHQRLLKNPA